MIQSLLAAAASNEDTNARKLLQTLSDSTVHTSTLLIMLQDILIC